MRIWPAENAFSFGRDLCHVKGIEALVTNMHSKFVNSLYRKVGVGSVSIGAGIHAFCYLSSVTHFTFISNAVLDERLVTTVTYFFRALWNKVTQNRKLDSWSAPHLTLMHNVCAKLVHMTSSPSLHHIYLTYQKKAGIRKPVSDLPKLCAWGIMGRWHESSSRF